VNRSDEIMRLYVVVTIGFALALLIIAAIISDLLATGVAA